MSELTDFFIELLIKSGLRDQWGLGLVLFLYKASTVINGYYKGKREEESALEAERLQKEQDRARRSMARSISEQVENFSSVGFVAMSNAVSELHKAGVHKMTYRVVDGEFEKTLAGFLMSYQKELKNVCFKQILPRISDHIKDDQTHYIGNNWENYTQDTAGDIRDALRRGLGKRLGTSDLLDKIFEESLTYELFLTAYTKLINRARENEGLL